MTRTPVSPHQAAAADARAARVQEILAKYDSHLSSIKAVITAPIGLTPAKQREWIAALRSGKYTQGTGTLRTVQHEDDAVCYCCLGVHALLEGADFSHDHVMETDGHSKEIYAHAGFIPAHFYNDLNILPRYVQFPLTELNDSGHFSFAEIADLLEFNLELRNMLAAPDARVRP